MITGTWFLENINTIHNAKRYISGNPENLQLIKELEAYSKNFTQKKYLHYYNYNNSRGVEDIVTKLFIVYDNVLRRIRILRKEIKDGEKL